jgi:hypothetical protein
MTDRSSPGADGPVLSTDDGVEFLRTPDTRFEGLPGWPYAPRHVEIDGLRQAATPSTCTGSPCTSGRTP